MNDEEIYYGSNKVELYPCTGEYINFDISAIEQDEYSEENVNKVIINIDDLSRFKPEYSNIYINCIPETNIYLLKNNSIPPNEEFSKNCFLKYKDNMNIPGSITAIKSGHRSAIIKGNSGNYYKFKGCGNDDLGFNVEKKKHFPSENAVRGCGYETTCVRELYYTYKVNEILKKVGMQTANTPIGVWKYSNDLKFISSNDNIEKPLNSVPELDKYCGIFMTKGDKRARTHLLGGLEILLIKIISILFEEKLLNEGSLNYLLKLFPDHRKKKFNLYIKYSEMFPPRVNKRILSLDEWCQNPIFTIEQYHELILNSTLEDGIKNTNDVLKIINENSNKILDKICEKLLIDKTEKQKITITELIKNIKLLLEKTENYTFFLLILDIFKEIGYETGKIKRILQDNHIAWGTYYEDHNEKYQCYTNAHPNNLIVLPKGNSTLLAPTDFDYNYTRENYINTVKPSRKYKQIDVSYYENYVLSELSFFIEYFIDNKVFYFLGGIKEELKEGSNEFNVKEAVKYLLYDSLIECYMKSFDKVMTENPIKNIAENDLLHNLVKLCLVLTCDLIA